MPPAETPAIRDLVDVARVDTVVRLDGREGRLAELVVTADVAQALAEVLGAVAEGRVLGAAAATAPGGAFFLVAHFGAGKSHFLAALAEVLAGAPGDPTPDAWDAALREAAVAARPCLPVAVPLVEHRAGAQLDDLVVARAYAALGLPAPPAGTDRAAAWEGLEGAVHAAGHVGLALLLDELSEFLRAKQGPDLVEDLRFLQFLGEWAAGRRVVVVAALQESIEEVANVSQRALARIRDRYRTLPLTMRHVEDLVRGRLVRLRPGAEEAVEAVHRDLAAAFPGWGVARERFVRSYPLHPATLSVLEGLQFLFSQQRGVVDFITRQLLGDEAAGIPAWQDREATDVLTPDRVYDHFRARLHERLETHRLADAVVPYVERAAAELFDGEADRELALRVTKLLCLLAASPVERARTAAELAHLLLTRVSALDPHANVAYLEHVILEPLVTRGAYVVRRAAPQGDPVYAIELEADAAEVASARLAQARAELSSGDRRVVRTLVELGSSPSLPLQLLGEVGAARRELLWHNTLRSLLVALVRVPELEPADVDGHVERARAMRAAGCLLVAEPELERCDLADAARELAGRSARVAVWVPAELAADEVDAALELHSRRLVLEQARAEGRTGPDGLVEFLERHTEGDAARARELLRRAYFGGEVVTGAGTDVDLPSLAGLAFDRQLVALADPLLARLHPLHREVAPQAQLVGDRMVRELVVGALSQPRIGGAAARGPLGTQVAGYLKPLGLVRRQGDAWLVAPDPARSPAVAELLRLVPGNDPVPAADVLARLAEGPVGLTEPEALLVVNACVQAGLLEAWRGTRRAAEPLLVVTASDRLSAGTLLEPAVREGLVALQPLLGDAPLEPWNAAVQRGLWERARDWLEAQREHLAAVASGLAALRDGGDLADVATDAVRGDVALVTGVVDACDGAADPAAGLRGLVGAVADADADADVVAAAAGRLAAVARFLREERTRIAQAVAYLTDRELELPPEERQLGVLRDQALALARDVLALAAADRIEELRAVYREFREAYAATYRDAHERFYAATGAAAVEAVRASPSYQALAALSAIGALAVPDDLVKVDRALAVPPRCTRPLDLELQWRPRCPCGFRLGMQPATVDVAALTALAAGGVRQHLEELGRTEHRARLEQAAIDLAGLGREEVAADLRQLLALMAQPVTADPLAVAHLAVPPVATVVRDVLAGGRLVVRRDLAALREDVIGRRYSRRRLLELVEAWLDADGDLPAGGFVEVVDSHEGAVAGMPGRARDAGSGTEAFLAERYPRLAAALPSERPADAFWLAAWWAGRPDPPAWLPPPLLAESEWLSTAAAAASADDAARGDLAALDARVGAASLLGDEVDAALGLGARSADEVAAALADERLLRHPLRLAATELVRRIAGDWRVAEQLGDEVDAERIAARHALADAAELAPLDRIVAAGRHLAVAERRLAGATCRELVEDLYPSMLAPVPELLSRAELAMAGDVVVAPEAIDGARGAAGRLLAAADAALREHADGGFPGCLPLWDVGRGVLVPLLRAHDRVAVLLVDAMRADLWWHLRDRVAEVLPGRVLRQAWAVVPQPTRTAEALAALYLGRQVPAGSAPSPSDLGPPFAHLGVESQSLVGVDGAEEPQALRELWAAGPRLAVAVATAVDALVHRSSVELAALLDDALAGLERRVVPALSALPRDVPLVVLADHGFRENAAWGRGAAARYAHGGVSLEECVVPVATFRAAT